MEERVKAPKPVIQHRAGTEICRPQSNIGQWVRKVWMIEEVESVSAELKVEAVGDREFSANEASTSVKPETTDVIPALRSLFTSSVAA